MPGRPRLPPLPQQIEDLRWQHHVPVLATLRLDDADDHLRTLDVASALLSLIGHDRHEGDARGIVDADVDELPADAMVTVDHAGLASGDAMAHRADAAELFDIEMDELARPLAFVATDR